MTVNTLGSDLTEGRARSGAWLWPLLPIALTTFALSALVSFHVRADAGSETHSLLQGVIVGVYQWIGFVPAFLFFLLVLAWSSIWFLTGRLERPGMRVLRLVGLTLALAIWVNLRAEAGPAPAHAGAIGAWIGGRMVSALGYVLSTLIVAPLTLAALLLATDFFFYRYFEGMGARPAAPPRGGPRAEPTESGVEADVTEHFKALSADLAPGSLRAGPAGSLPRIVARPPAARAGADAIDADEDEADAIQADAIEADAIEADEVDEALEAGEAGDSYYERRKRRQEAEDAGEAGSEAAAAAARADGDEFAIAAAALDAGLSDPPDEEPAAEAAGEEPRAPGRAGGDEHGPAGWALSSDESQEIGDPEGDLAARLQDEAPAGAAADEADERDPNRDPGEAAEDAAGSGAAPGEPVVPIPRPPEGVRQQRLFVHAVDEGLLREAIDLVTSSRRASATFLQRQLRVDFEQAMEILDVLTQRGVIERNEGETQGRVR